MAAYKALINSPCWNIDNAITISGMSDQSSFGKKFLKTFNMTPTEAYKYGDTSLFISPATWENISSNLYVNYLKGDSIKNMKKQEIFGISEEHYEKVIEAYTLEGLYGFEPSFSKIAFESSVKLQTSLLNTFPYLDSIRDYIIETQDDDDIDCLSYIPKSKKESQIKKYINVNNKINDIFTELLSKHEAIKPIHIEFNSKQEYIISYITLFNNYDIISIKKEIFSFVSKPIKLLCLDYSLENIVKIFLIYLIYF